MIGNCCLPTYDALEAYSKPIMQIIKFIKDKKQKLTVLNASEVEGFYRFPDLTAQTEYICKVIETAISHDLPNELNFLQNYDKSNLSVRRIAGITGHSVITIRKIKQLKEI